MKELQKINGSAKLLLIWDGASYHRGEEMRKFLEEQNEGLEEEDWKVRCQRFAPYAPEENPVEAILATTENILNDNGINSFWRGDIVCAKMLGFPLSNQPTDRRSHYYQERC